MWILGLKGLRHLNLCELIFDSLIHYGSKGGAVVRALASHQCGWGLNPADNTICELILVLSLAPRDFSHGTPVFPSPGIIQIF